MGAKYLGDQYRGIVTNGVILNYKITMLIAYVFGSEIDDVLEEISSVLGKLVFVERIEEYQFYDIGSYRLTVEPSASGFTSFMIARCEIWQNDVELARFLGKTIRRRIRCDPGVTFPEVNPYSDVFLQIEDGQEELINWDDEESN